jgi:hypothetical protein
MNPMTDMNLSECLTSNRAQNVHKQYTFSKTKWNTSSLPIRYATKRTRERRYCTWRAITNKLSSGYAAGSIEHPIRSAVPSNLVLRFQSIYRATENSPEISLPPTIGCLAGRQKWLHFRHSPLYCSKWRPALASS